MSRTKRLWQEMQERLERETGEDVAPETVDEAVADWFAGQADYLRELARDMKCLPMKK